MSTTLAPAPVHGQHRPKRLPNHPSRPKISHEVIHDSASDDDTYAPIPFLNDQSSSYEYYSDSADASPAIVSSVSTGSVALAPRPPAGGPARAPPRPPTGAPARPIPRRFVPPPAPAPALAPAAAPAPAPAPPAAPPPALPDRFSFSTLLKTKKISIKGAKFTFALWALGREVLSARFSSSDTAVTITQDSQTYAFLRGEHNVHFALRGGSKFGDDIWSVRFTGTTRDGVRTCTSYFLKDTVPGLPTSMSACTAPEECRAAIAKMLARGESPYAPNKRNLVLITADAAREPVAAFGKLIGGGYGVLFRAEVSPLIVFAFGMAAWLAPRNPK
jgi:hypothetical protein